MEWYYNQWSGSTVQMNSAQYWLAHFAPGWHGPFNTRDEAIAFYEANRVANPGWVRPVDQFGIPLTTDHGNTSDTVKNAASGIASAVTAPYTAAKSAVSSTIDIWILRIGEIVLGLVLIAVGVVGLTRVQEAVKTTAKAASLAAL